MEKKKRLFSASLFRLSVFSGLLASLSIGCSRSILFKPYHFGYIAVKTSDPFLFYSLWSILPKLFCVAGSVICQIITSVSLLPPSLCFPNGSLVILYSFSAQGFLFDRLLSYHGPIVSVYLKSPGLFNHSFWNLFATSQVFSESCPQWSSCNL